MDILRTFIEIQKHLTLQITNHVKYNQKLLKDQHRALKATSIV